MSLDNPVDKLADSIESIYQAFFRKLSEDRDYVYIPSSKDRSVILGFISLINEKYGIEGLGDLYIYNYFVFQLDYWDGLETRFGKRIPIGWMIGKKAFNRWIVRREKDLWHAHRTAAKYKINKGIITSSTHKRSPLDLFTSEEVEKRRHYNDAEGMIGCYDNTTLFNHRSKLCMSCIWKISCITLLKAEMPNIYIMRGYLKDEKIRNKK